MTTPSRPDGPQGPDGPDGSRPEYADRAYRSPSALAGGGVLLALILWLGLDAVVHGSGRTPWAALAGMLLAVPLVVAFTFRPAVHAGTHRMRVRNPFRTVGVPWSQVEAIRSGYSNEVVADGVKYQLWAIPVSFRARKAAHRHNQKVEAGKSSAATRRTPADQAVTDLRELAEKHGQDGEQPAEPGPVEIRWAYEVLVPILLGAVAVAVVLATR